MIEFDLYEESERDGCSDLYAFNVAVALDYGNYDPVAYIPSSVASAMVVYFATHRT